jgi:hypothetical protein
MYLLDGSVKETARLQLGEKTGLRDPSQNRSHPRRGFHVPTVMHVVDGVPLVDHEGDQRVSSRDHGQTPRLIISFQKSPGNPRGKSGTSTKYKKLNR